MFVRNILHLSANVGPGLESPDCCWGHRLAPGSEAGSCVCCTCSLLQQLLTFFFRSGVCVPAARGAGNHRQRCRAPRRVHESCTCAPSDDLLTDREPLIPAGFLRSAGNHSNALLLCFSGTGGARQRHHGNPEHQLHPEVGLGPELEAGRDLHSGICRVGVPPVCRRAHALPWKHAGLF